MTDLRVPTYTDVVVKARELGFKDFRIAVTNNYMSFCDVAEKVRYKGRNEHPELMGSYPQTSWYGVYHNGVEFGMVEDGVCIEKVTQMAWDFLEQFEPAQAVPHGRKRL